jgi:hypothetical protein
MHHQSDRTKKPDRVREEKLPDLSSDQSASEDTDTSFWKEFGLTPPPQLDESTAPPVDRDLLLRVEQGKASKDEQEQVAKLTRSYRSWGRARVEIGLDEVARIQREDPDAFES